MLSILGRFFFLLCLFFCLVDNSGRSFSGRFNRLFLSFRFRTINFLRLHRRRRCRRFVGRPGNVGACASRFMRSSTWETSPLIVSRCAVPVDGICSTIGGCSCNCGLCGGGGSGGGLSAIVKDGTPPFATPSFLCCISNSCSSFVAHSRATGLGG